MSLDTYIITPKEVTVGGKVVAVTPLRVRQLPAFSRAIAPCADLFMGGNVLAAVAAHGDDLVTAIAVATGETEEWLGGLLPDEFVLLVSAVVEVNADFFVQRVAPALKQAQTAVVGAMSLPSSSPTDTA